jgi:hypothetical protein
MFEGLLNRSAVERRIPRKAPFLPLHAYKLAIKQHIITKLDEPQQVSMTIIFNCGYS